MRQRIYAFLDTTEWSEGSRMTSPGWDSLRSAVAKKRLELAVSEITIKELERQVGEKVTKFNQLISGAARKLSAHSLDLGVLPVASSESFTASFRHRLSMAGVQSIPIATPAHTEIVERDIDSRKPFSRGGSGYRDTLIWLSFLDWVKEAPPGSVACFVSANKDDFGSTDGGALALHPDLLPDVPDGVEVRYLEKFADLVRLVRDAASDITSGDSEADPRAAGAEAVAIFAGLVGYPIDDLPVSEPVDEFPPIFEGRVVKVDVFDDDIESELVDTLDLTQIWSVRCGAWIRIEGGLHRDELANLPRGWMVTRVDLSQPVTLVAAWFECTLVAEVRVGDDHRATDGALVDVHLRAGRRWGTESSAPDSATATIW
jgi:hypothetical protein